MGSGPRVCKDAHAVAALPAGAYAHPVSAKALDLFTAYRSDRIPAGGGYILSSFMVDGSAYARYEIIAYRAARTVRLSDDGLSFAADASRVYLLVEPVGYHDSATEPWQRDARHRVPHTFAEMTTVSARHHSRILVSTSPVRASALFTVTKPGGIDFAFLFLPGREALTTIHAFLEQTLRDECLIPAAAARRAAELVRSRLAACDVTDRPW